MYHKQNSHEDRFKMYYICVTGHTSYFIIITYQGVGYWPEIYFVFYVLLFISKHSLQITEWLTSEVGDSSSITLQLLVSVLNFLLKMSIVVLKFLKTILSFICRPTFVFYIQWIMFFVYIVKFKMRDVLDLELKATSACWIMLSSMS